MRIEFKAAMRPGGGAVETTRVLPVTDFAVKALADGSGEVSGYASVFDVIDHHDDVVHRGAFTKTIRERVAKGKVPFLDSHMMDGDHTNGTVVEAREDDRGLFFRATLSSAPAVQARRVKMAEGHLRNLSIGFVPIVEDFERQGGERGRIIRHLREVSLVEISSVVLGANEECTLVDVKSATDLVGAVTLAPLDAEWDEAKARERLLAWATKDGEILPPRLRKGFASFDAERPFDVAGYVWPIADVRGDGTIAIVPEAVLRAVAAEEKSATPNSAARATLDLLLARMRAEGLRGAISGWTPPDLLRKFLCEPPAGCHHAARPDGAAAAGTVPATGTSGTTDAGPRESAPTTATGTKDRAGRLREMRRALWTEDGR